MARKDRIRIPGEEVAWEAIAARFVDLIKAHERELIGDAYLDILETCRCECLYVLYQHFVHPGMNQARLMSREDAISFLRQWIVPGVSGVDLMIAPMDLSFAILCNHDGDVWLIAG